MKMFIAKTKLLKLQQLDATVILNLVQNLISTSGDPETPKKGAPKKGQAG